LEKKVRCKKTGEMILLQEPDEIRKQYGLEIHPDPLQVNGRIIDEPKISGRGILLFTFRSDGNQKWKNKL
jgi:hypothetical protein